MDIDDDGTYLASELARAAIREVGGMEKLTRGALPHDRGGMPQFFWVSEEEEMESAPRDMRLKWKRLLQKRSGDNTEDEEVTGESGDSKWPDLPMELLVHIMALVDNRTIVVASGVCTAWRESLRLGILELTFSWCGRNVTKLVQSLAPKFSRVQTCTLCRCPHLNDMAIEALGRHMDDLRVLDLTSCIRLTDVALLALAGGCVRLEKLNLSGCLGITDIGLVVLAQRCKALRQLNLCGCENAGSDKALMALGGNCCRLQYLNVGWCERITDRGVSALALGCSDLRVVDLCGCHFITDRSVMVLADHCLRLRALNLYRCQNITDLAMYSLAKKGNPHRAGAGRGTLKRLGSSSGELPHDRRAVATSSSGSCSGRSSSSSSSSCDSVTNHQSSTRGYIETLVNDPEGYGLMSLNLSGCRALSASAVQAVCNAYPALHTCPDRCSLNISGCLNLTSVHCKCAMEASRERVSRASRYMNQVSLDPRNLPL